jgi:hypothetical protein
LIVLLAAGSSAVNSLRAYTKRPTEQMIIGVRCQTVGAFDAQQLASVVGSHLQALLVQQALQIVQQRGVVFANRFDEVRKWT